MKRAIPILLLLVTIGAGYYWWHTRDNTGEIGLSIPIDPLRGEKPTNRILASGTIEAESVAISTETGGRVIAVYADEGEQVRRGDLLVELETSLLQANQNQLEAALAAARANLAEVTAAPRPEDIAAAEAELQQAQASCDGALAVWKEAQSMVDKPLELNTRITAAQGQIAVLEKEVEAAQAALKAAEIQRDEAARNQSDDAAITLSHVAAKQAEAAQANLAATQAELAGAQRQLEHLVAMRNQPVALIAQANAAKSAYEQAQAAVLVAEARLALVIAEPLPEEIAIAQAQVRQAEAALQRVQVQIDKMKLTAPRDGIITERSVNPGELAAPGATLMSLSDLNQVTVTVFIPETQIGRVQLGQPAQVSVDAYPDKSFEGRVTFIASEVEFTPKNVQTEEERVNLVLAVKISLANPDHRLKPGMPADVEIVTGL